MERPSSVTVCDPPGASADAARGARRGVPDLALILKGLPWPRFAHALALLLLASGVADWVWRLALPRPEPVPALLAAPAPSGADVGTILAAELFGPSPAGAGDGSDAAAVPVSGLNLMLAGVVAGGGAGLALIGVEGQPPQPFSAGQEILPGVVLEKVLPESVVLRRAGVAESLVLSGVEAGGLPSAPRPSPAERDAVVELKPRHYSIPRDVVRERLRSSDFLVKARMTPADGGGFLIQEVQVGSLYEKLGLRAGQVLRAVNGKPVDSVSDFLSLYRDLEGAGRLQLDVAQGGRTERLTYELR